MTIVTVSRGTFSGGKALAECLASRMDCPCLSREEVLLDAAGEFAISREELEAAMNEPPPFWQEVPAKRILYLKCVTAALLERAKEGRLVYHGHAGHLLLRGISHVLRVRVIADMEHRIRAAMERMGLDREETIAHLYKIDKDRERWTKFLYGVDWKDAGLYDVILNLERISIESACETVMHILGLDDFKHTPDSEKAFDDFALSSRVWIALARDERTKGAYVKITSDNGKVVVRGSVPSEDVIDIIPIVARTIKGVWHVKTEVGIGSDWYW